ncbi:MAG: hypothetical protein KA085_17305 [Phenylobacterium sp.]|uniref:hypothetical protein n=1 Tax=Phenylobacterium sp. TaxID=1871053 RepID=UPI001B6718AD|nr:hypothetical protein [Phenylobacterium sp.]MBP7651345.1 hypothetical protein [Phenylobacterium sp.]MBP7817877.1 hypothetical protein [Phenylobacterium sp.]MBP9232559.1 hypothetical protein [Phenylobacterium sp.]MBP9755766.1 hypothetical protein [Phenylobacterium sp.]
MFRFVLTAAAAVLIAAPASAQITLSPGTGAASTTGSNGSPGGIAASSAAVGPNVSGVGATSPLTEMSASGTQAAGNNAAVVRIAVPKVGQAVSDRDGVSLGVIERVYTVRGKKRLALRSEDRAAWILASTVLSTSTAGLVSTRSRAEVYGRRR